MFELRYGPGVTFTKIETIHIFKVYCHETLVSVLGVGKKMTEIHKAGAPNKKIYTSLCATSSSRSRVP